ncbi:cell wall metabolism sensor histidine kinase WalK [Ferruginibacter lapsinanis]|uniref:sensor histidine kinase n=1 Tax=Ferruginibacter lapsinanis TaxID=563172 RepID=UPI001E578BDF|nr:ATP-binding protein [Ferruginibacter lapsinanis]UEG50459.1 cell wall metabolism sensor histidine kinase WalK [Ferruginibacter lapsinanis]
MFSAKNFSPQQLSALTALILAVPIALGIYFFYPVWWVTLLSFIVIFLGSFGLILFMVQKFVYRKIKLIYKLIYQTKASKREEFYYKNILPQKSIDDVREDVEEWAIQRKEEIELLKRNEAYRKEFLQNLSHELKTPIFAIQGYVDTLLNGALENPEVNRKFLSSTSRNIDRLVNLADDLDEISKLEMGQLTLNQTNFIIQDLIKEVFESLAIKADEKQLKLGIKKGCEFPLTVYADKEKIRQVLINLIDNAIKYGKQNGEIEASAYKIDGKQILVEISDDGLGIGEEHLDRIFERFYRTDLARSRKIGGSGLGLAICKHIIEAHNQTIHVRSSLDIGTTFGFTLESKKD